MGKKKLKKIKKLNLVFDEEERKDYLSGFQKRKQERKMKAKDKIDKQMRELRIKLRKEKREKLKQAYLNQQGDPDLEAILPKEAIKTYDLPDQVVTISPMDPMEIGGSLNLLMGYNKFSSLPDDDAGEGVSSNSTAKR
ncbi:nucleolar protein 12-like [Panonychus citri]|uniref:nucleolar protein 12-like n=1 Tax=Panonychus citri TaxID=50023 RepID=UPI002307798D|nr:nucleolar protein 12-like [Panonychus citri]